MLLTLLGPADEKTGFGKDAALFGAMQTGLGGASPAGGAVWVCVCALENVCVRLLFCFHL